MGSCCAVDALPLGCEQRLAFFAGNTIKGIAEGSVEADAVSGTNLPTARVHVTRSSCPVPSRARPSVACDAEKEREIEAQKKREEERCGGGWVGQYGRNEMAGETGATALRRLGARCGRRLAGLSLPFDASFFRARTAAWTGCNLEACRRKQRKLEDEQRKRERMDAEVGSAPTGFLTAATIDRGSGSRASAP